MRHRVLLSAVTACAAVTLTACGSSGGSPGTGPVTGVPTSSPSPTRALPTSPSAPESTGVAAPSRPVTIDRTLSDPVFGNRVTVLSYVTGYQPSQAAVLRYAELADQVVVLVKVRITAGEKYFGSFGAGNLRLVGEPGGTVATTTGILDGELSRAGYKLLTAVNPGASATGWLVFLPQSTVAGYTLRLVRLAFTKTYGGARIPAKNFDLKLNG